MHRWLNILKKEASEVQEDCKWPCQGEISRADHLQAPEGQCQQNSVQEDAKHQEFKADDRKLDLQHPAATED